METSTNKKYEEAIEIINILMKRGESKVDNEQLKNLETLIHQVENYENEVYPFPMLKNISENRFEILKKK